MDGRDEFDGESDAPVPAHERIWRHPAEVNDARRQQHTRESAPPPIGRRATMLVAVVSVAASVALLAVTVPKGIAHHTAVAHTTPSTSTSAPAKGSTGPGHTTIAAPLDASWLLVPFDTPTTVRSVEVKGRGVVEVTRIYPFPESGYALARTVSSVSAEDGNSADLTEDELAYLLDGESLHVLEADGTTYAARWSTPVMASPAGSGYPVDVDAGFTGPGVLMTTAGDTVGIVTRMHHRNVLHLLGTVLTRVSANAGG